MVIIVYYYEEESVKVNIFVIILKEKAVNNFDYSPKAQPVVNNNFLPPNNNIIPHYWRI